MPDIKIKNISVGDIELDDLGLWIGTGTILDLSDEDTDDISRSTDLIYYLNSGEIVYIDNVSEEPLPVEEAVTLLDGGHSHKLGDLEEKSFASLTEVPSEFNPSTHDHNDLYYDKLETDSRIQGIVDAAPENLDTLSEIATQLEDDADAVNALTVLIGTKADITHNHDDLYHTVAEMTGFLTTKSDTDHIHDNRYHTKSEIVELTTGFSLEGHDHNEYYISITAAGLALATKADTSHNHNLADIGERDYSLMTNTPADDDYATLTFDPVPAANALVPMFKNGEYKTTSLASIVGALAQQDADLIWNVSSGNISLQATNRYLLNGGAKQIVTLPAVAQIGDIFGIIGFETQWEIKSNAGAGKQCLIRNGVHSLCGEGESIVLCSSMTKYSHVQLICVKENEEFMIMMDDAVNYTAGLFGTRILHYTYDTSDVAGSTVKDVSIDPYVFDGESFGVRWDSDEVKVGNRSARFRKRGHIRISNFTMQSTKPNFTIASWLMPQAGDLRVDLDNPKEVMIAHLPGVWEIKIVNGKLVSRIYPEEEIISDTLLEASVWSHIALTFDGTYVRQFIGTSEQAHNTLKTTPLLQSMESIFVGAEWGTSNRFDGRLDNTQFFIKDLNVGEIQLLMDEV